MGFDRRVALPVAVARPGFGEPYDGTCAQDTLTVVTYDEIGGA